ncbi:MAG TPA: MoaD/ThiS family protein [Gaiellaceae bacterium]|nr:MoaD/ThiS family protein [Gaiellaceae bacterium]
MARVRLPTVLRPLADGRSNIEVAAQTFGGLRDGIRAGYPALAERLYDGNGRVREFVSVFVEGEDARALPDDAPLAERSDVVLLPAISGG